jgi:hypothetical protein
MKVVIASYSNDLELERIILGHFKQKLRRAIRWSGDTLTRRNNRNRLDRVPARVPDWGSGWDFHLLVKASPGPWPAEDRSQRSENGVQQARPLTGPIPGPSRVNPSGSVWTAEDRPWQVKAAERLVALD